MNEVEQYIATFPDEVSERLKQIRAVVLEVAPEATERICMRIPTFDLAGKWFIHYAGFKKHIGFYPQPEGIEAFAEQLKPYKSTKGGVQFPLNKPLPIDLIREIIVYRAKQQQA